MRLKLCLLFVLIITFSWSQSGPTKTFTTNGTFPVPAGVTSIFVQAWGGGGSGGGASGAPLLLGRGAAGGGGGAFASAPVSVTPGTTLNVVVAGQTAGTSGNGATGGNSTITGFESSVLAAGGSGGVANNAGGTPAGGSGGTIAASAGTTKFAGTNGGNGNSWNLLGLLLSSGSGGSGAGPAGAGTAGAGGLPVSGLILSNAPGVAGSPPGGAGSGAINSALGASQIGGAGAAGRVVISYTCATFSISSTTATGVCASDGSTSAVTLTSSAGSLPVGNYVVTYNRSIPSATALTANLTVTTAGTGTFTAVGLTTTGSSTITITKLTSETCASTINANNTVTILVSPATVGGIVSGGSTINSGNTSGLLTLSGHTGSVIKWQSSVSPFTTWTDIANTTTTYTSGVLTATTQFRAVVQSGNCAIVNSAPTTVTVVNLVTIDLDESGSDVCLFNSDTIVSIIGYGNTIGSPTTYSIVWNSSPPNSFAPVIDQVLSPSPLILVVPAGTVAGTYTGTFTVKNANGDVSSPAEVFSVSIYDRPVLSATGTTIDSVCASTSSQNASFAYTGVSGNPVKYYIDWNDDANAASLQDQAITPFAFAPSGGIINNIAIPANVPAGTYFGLMYISNLKCDQRVILSITISPETVGGAVTGGTTITSGSTSGLLTLSGHTGSVIKWQSSVSPFTTWVDIANTITTYTSGALTATTQFRAVVQSGTCAIVNSEPTTVTVEDLPTITVASTNLELCLDSSDPSNVSIPISYTEITGSPITYSVVWNSSPPNNFVNIVDEPIQYDNWLFITIPYSSTEGTYTGTLTVKNASGAISAGITFDVLVHKVALITTEGVLSTICTSNNPQFSHLDYDNSTGNPIRYEINWNNTANAALLADIPVTPYTFDPDGGTIEVEIAANVLPGTYYGRINIETEFCIKDYDITLTVTAGAVGGTVTGGTTIATGSTSGLLTLSGNTGFVQYWQSSVSPFTTWTDIANTDTTYTSGPLTETTQFRAVVRRGLCFEVNSEPTTVTVTEVLPTIALNAATENRCYGSNNNNVKLAYTGTTGDPVTYSIVWNSSPANSLVPVTDVALPASPIGITVPTGTTLPEGTYTGTLTVKDANGIVSTGYTFTLTVGGLGFVLTQGDINPINTSTSSQNAVLPYSGTSINNPQYLPTKYFIDWDQAANNASLADQSTTPFTFSSSGGAINTILIPANVPAGTYTGVMYIYNENSCNQSQAVSIVINPIVPSIELVSSLVRRCSDGYDYSHYVALPYNQVTGNPVTYSIVWDSSPANTFTAVTDAALPASPISILFPYNAATGIYTGTLTVKNANGTISSPIDFNVGITLGPSRITTTGAITPVTTAANSQTTTLQYSGIVNSPYEYYIDWNATANAASLTDQPTTQFTFNSSGGTIDSINIPANVAPGTYSGTLYTPYGGTCDYPHPVTVTINPIVPSIRLSSTIITTCSTNDVSEGFLNYIEPTGNPTTYSIVWSAFPINDLVNVTDEALPADSIPVSIAAGTSPGSYSGTLTVKNANGISSQGIDFSLIVNEAPTFTTFNDFTICGSTDLQFLPPLNYETTGSPTSYYIDWDNAANFDLLEDQAVTLNTFEQEGQLTTIEISANAQSGQHFGTLYVTNGSCTGSERISVIILPQPEAPIIGVITPSQIGASTGSVALSGLPSDVDGWTITTNPITETVEGFGSSTVITGLAGGTYTFEVLHNRSGCLSIPSEEVEVFEVIRGFAKESVTTGKSKENLDSPENTISVSSFNKIINIETPNQNINEVFVFDLSGNLLYKKNSVRNSKLVIDNLRSSNQVLVVKVVLDNNETQTRKVIF